MKSQRPQRIRKLRDREAFNGGGYVDILCHCSKRLGYFSATQLVRGRGQNRSGTGLDGIYGGKNFGQHSTAVVPAADGSGQLKNVAHEDWNQFQCPKCGREHRVRDAALVALIEKARSLNLDRIKLPDTHSPRADRRSSATIRSQPISRSTRR